MGTEQGTVQNVHYGDVLIIFDELLDVSRETLLYISDTAKCSHDSFDRLQDGDVIIADTAEDQTVGKCTEIVNVRETDIVAGLHTMPCRPKEKFGVGYLGFYMNSTAFHDQLLPLMQGTKVTSISREAISGTTLSFPTNIKEQECLGAFFQGVDNTIALHQRMQNWLYFLKGALIL